MNVQADRLWLLGALVAIGVWTVALCGPGLWGAHNLPAGAFHPSHAFFAWHLGMAPSGGQLSQPPLGWPGSPTVQLIGGVPLALAALLQELGPMRAYASSLLVGPLLTVVATWGWLSRVVAGRPDARALGCVAFASCSFAVAALGNGQLAKMQLWVIPAVLWSVAVFRDKPGVGRGALILSLTVAGVFSAPSLAVQLPIAVLVQVGMGRPGLRSWDRVRSRDAVAALAWMGVGLLPGLVFLGAGENAGTRPAVAVAGARVGGAAPSASLDDLLFGLGTRGDGWAAVNHAPVIGGLALVIGVVLARRRGAGRGTALGLLIVGAILSLGPTLYWGAEAVVLGGWTISMPADWLTALGYPLGQTGQWYRFVVVASLGLAALLARADTPRRVMAVALAVIVGAIQGVHQSGHVFPRPAVAVPAADTMRALRTGTSPGALVVLPMIASTADGGAGLAMAALSGRPTSAMARHTEAHPATTALRALLQRAHAAHTIESARRVLSEAGVAVVVWRPDATLMRGEVWLDVEAVAADLGPPRMDGRAAVWWIDDRP